MSLYVATDLLGDWDCWLVGPLADLACVAFVTAASVAVAAFAATAVAWHSWPPCRPCRASGSAPGPCPPEGSPCAVAAAAGAIAP